MEAYADIRSYGGDVERHRHSHAQIVLPWHGQMDIEIEGRAGRVTRGLAVFIEAGSSHVFSAPRENAFVVLDLTPQAETVDRSERSRPFFAVRPRIEALLDYLTAMTDGLPARPAIPSAWTSLLLDSLDLGAGVSRSVARPLSGRDRAALERAETFMRAQLARPIRVADVARAAGLSTTRLGELFRNLRGAPPHAVLGRMRAEAACRLLVDSDRPIAEVAVMTGHADQSALNRRLKTLGRPTPAMLRRHGRVSLALPKIPSD